MSLYRNIDSEENMALIEEFRSAITRNYTIDSELYNEYNVKRGLRNANGTGSLWDLQGSGTHAYIMDENEKVPVEGRLLYRGIDINDFVEGFQRDKRFDLKSAATCCYLENCRQGSGSRHLPGCLAKTGDFLTGLPGSDS